MKKHNKNASKARDLLPMVLIASSLGILVLSTIIESSVWPFVLGAAASLCCVLAIHEFGKKKNLALQAEVQALLSSVGDSGKTDHQEAELLQLAEMWVPTLNSQLSTANSQMSAVASLSERVATLEKQLNRPSILLSIIASLNVAGQKMLHNFLYGICGLSGNFTMQKREQQCVCKTEARWQSSGYVSHI